jgi:hypothetical protein
MLWLSLYDSIVSSNFISSLRDRLNMSNFVLVFTKDVDVFSYEKQNFYGTDEANSQEQCQSSTKRN